MSKFIFSLAITLIWSCANRMPPTGGPKDKEPPKLVTSIPKIGATNVNPSKITLLFDQFVTTKNIRKELLITPLINFDYKYETKRKTVILTLEQPLDSATTYNFNFKNSIVDITEANPAVDLILSFSTGPILDTLKISGTVTDLFTGKPVNKLVVGLFIANDTLNLFNSPPYYLAQTNKKGNYLFKNIKKRKYIINAFLDKNNNLICESDKEPYAFTNKSIPLDSTTIIDTLRIQSLNLDTLKLKYTKNSGKYFIAITNKYLTKLKLKASNDSTIWYSLDKKHKEIKIYNTFEIKDSLMVEMHMTDSLNKIVKDNFYLKFTESKRKYDKYSSTISNLFVFPKSRKITFTVNTSKPSHFVYKDSIYIKKDSLKIPFDSTWNITINKKHTEFNFSNYLPKPYLDSLKKTQENTLYIPFASFRSVESDSSKTLEKTIMPKYKKNFGILMGNILTNQTHYFIQIIDKRFNVVKEIKPKKKYKFINLAPKEYLIRILIDSNKNGKWDAGNILLNQLPEPIIIYKNEDGISKITIKANWEISIDLTF
jgi:hypothetical protein